MTKLIVVLASVAVLLASGCGGGGVSSPPPAPVVPPAPVPVPPGGPGASTGNFTPVANLASARADHTATLLPNGKVLIAGGFGGNFQPLASAELYDPSTGKFTSTSNMNTSRAWHTAILLADGKVLIAGGVQDSQLSTFLVSAEIYDPSTGTFASTGNMILGGRVRSTLLPDGKVLIAQDGNVAEIYDPASGTFSLTSAYTSSSPVLVDTATLLPDGRVLVTGCAAQCSVGTTEVYDSRTGMFSATGPRRAWDSISTATLLMNGTVLFVEGNDSALPDDAEVYDPASGIFTHIGFTSDVHEFSAATRLLDGTVLIAGGQLAGGNGNPSAELYVPATGMFNSAGNMITGRHEHTATLLPDGTVLMAGGYSIWPTPTSNAEIYKPQAAHKKAAKSLTGRALAEISEKRNSRSTPTSSSETGKVEYAELHQLMANLLPFPKTRRCDPSLGGGSAYPVLPPSALCSVVTLDSALSPLAAMAQICWLQGRPREGLISPFCPSS